MNPDKVPHITLHTANLQVPPFTESKPYFMQDN